MMGYYIMGQYTAINTLPHTQDSDTDSDTDMHQYNIPGTHRILTRIQLYHI